MTTKPCYTVPVTGAPIQEIAMNRLPEPALIHAAANRSVQGLVPRTDFQPQPLLAPAALEVTWARHLDEVREAQRLRFEVFAGEMGATLPKAVPGHDVDLFDDYCEHLLVRTATPNST